MEIANTDFFYLGSKGVGLPEMVSSDKSEGRGMNRQMSGYKGKGNLLSCYHSTLLALLLLHYFFFLEDPSLCNSHLFFNRYI